MNLTKENYFGYNAMREYMSVSQFKTFLECPERMLAEQIGEYERPKSKDLLMGSYVDAYFSGEMEDFVEQTPELFRRDGGLKAEFMQCNRIIARAKEDPFFMSFLDAPVKQQILTGEICGHPWKIKVDALHEDKIVDLKVLAAHFKAYKKALAAGPDRYSGVFFAHADYRYDALFGAYPAGFFRELSRRQQNAPQTQRIQVVEHNYYD